MRLSRNNCQFRLVNLLGVTLLLVVYSATAVRLDLLHRYLHQENLNELHSAKQESNPCHKKIFHHSAEGCDHQSHFTENTKCPLCDCTMSFDQSLSKNEGQNIRLADRIPESVSIACLPHNLRTINSDRGPPILA